MAKSPQLTDEDVLQAVDREIAAAAQYVGDKIAYERRVAYEYYNGMPFGNEEEGKSQVVSQLVMEVIDSMLPDLLKIFTGGERVVDFIARSAEVEKAGLHEQAAEVCNYVLMSQNNGFLILYSALKDALLQKTGVIHYFWHVEQSVSQENYEYLTQGDILFLQQDKGVEIVAAQQNPPVMGQAQGEPTWNVTIKRTKDSGKVRLECVPPEQFLVTDRADTMDVQEVPFVCRRQELTKSDLVEMGYPVETVRDLTSGNDAVSTVSTEERLAREYRTGAQRGASLKGNESESNDPMQSTVVYTESFIRLDVDGDGISELRRVCKVGDEILYNEPTERVPFAVGTPKIMPHEFIGVSVADDVADLQLLKSTLWRQTLDNLYQTNNPRLVVIENMVELDDVMSPSPGGMIRATGPGAVEPIVVPMAAQHSLSMIEFLEQEVEGRTPVSRYYQGLDPKSLNKTATGVNILTSRSQARLELVARIFSETLIKDLFKGILWLLAKHQHESMIVRLRGEYTPIDPRAWTTEYDLQANVALGAGNKQEQMAMLTAIEQAQTAAVGGGGLGLVVTPKNIYNLQAKKALLAGYKDPGAFWTDPGDKPPPQPGPPKELLVEQERQKGKQQEQQMSMMAEQQKAQLDAQERVADRQSQITVEKYKADLTAQTELRKKLIDVAAQLILADAQHEQQMQDTAQKQAHEAGMAQMGQAHEAQQAEESRAHEAMQGDPAEDASKGEAPDAGNSAMQKRMTQIEQIVAQLGTALLGGGQQ
jgi:hypothetical protein